MVRVLMSVAVFLLLHGSTGCDDVLVAPSVIPGEAEDDVGQVDGEQTDA